MNKANVKQKIKTSQKLVKEQSKLLINNRYRKEVSNEVVRVFLNKKNLHEV